jgi:hypothetical protein
VRVKKGVRLRRSRTGIGLHHKCNPSLFLWTVTAFAVCSIGLCSIG